MNFLLQSDTLDITKDRLVVQDNINLLTLLVIAMVILGLLFLVVYIVKEQQKKKGREQG
jgi:uncharacterized membrane protein YqjE